MSEQLEETISRLEGERQKRVVMGDWPGVAELYGQQGLAYALAQQWLPAATVFGEVAAIAAGYGQSYQQGQAHFLRGQLLSRVAEARPEALLAFQTAAFCFASSGRNAEAANSRYQATLLRATMGQYELAIEEAESMLAAHAQDENKLVMVELLCLQAHCHWLAARPEQSLACLDKAIAYADGEVAGRLKSYRQLLSLLQGRELSLPAYIAFVQQLQPMLATFTRPDEQLGVAAAALANGQLEQAIELAGQAQQTAAQANDVLRFLRYLLAVLIMAEAYHRQDKRLEVETTLLSGRDFFQQRLGNTMNEPIDQLLASLRQRWAESQDEH